MGTNRPDRSARRRRYRRRRIALMVLIFLLFVSLLTALFWGLNKLVDNAMTGSDKTTTTASTTTTAPTTTTTRPTVPTLDASSLESQLTSKHIIAYNVTHETEIYSRDADTVCDPASTTKLMTAAVLAKHAPEDMLFPVGDEQKLVSSGSSLADIQVGQTLTFSQIMDALLIPSGNDAAYALAANVGRLLANDDTLDAAASVAVFMEEMNRLTREIGCTNTHFVNPDGMTAAGHQTTARDMLRIARYANSFEAVRNSVRKTAVSTTIGEESFYWKNSNDMLHSSSPYNFTYITGMKTGYTTPAGYCLVASANRIGEEVIVVVMGGNTSEERFRDTYLLMDAAFSHRKE